MSDVENGETEPVIGLIGVGLAGSAIADRLAAAGKKVFGFDVASIESDQVEPCSKAAEVFQKANSVFLSLPTSEIVSGSLAEVSPFITGDHLIIDTTTGSADAARQHQQLCADKGAAFVEASLYVGSEELAFERARPFLGILSDRIYYLGSVGAASRFKLVFNLALGLHRAVLAEALHFGEALGFPAETILEILSNSPAHSAVMGTKGRKMVEHDYQPPQARLSQHLKDVHIILETANSAGIETPLSETHRQLLERAEQAGFGGLDNAAVREAFRNRPKDTAP
jgi:3-hydroxyisobutyrate dehydrogenase-like beta-hydroxyacid dehydrogenase